MIKINNKKISLNCKPFIIAEMSGNHNQSLEKALEIVEKAHEIGADAIKIQTYTPDTITIKSNMKDFIVHNKLHLWKGKTLHQLYGEAYTPWDWHKKIFDKANSLGITIFSSPFDDTAVDFLEKLNVPCYKIASFEITDTNLIKRCALTKKPIIISTGMASLSEIDQAVRVAKNSGCVNIILLKCTSNYPANPSDSNLSTIRHMRELFNCEVGLSDHTKGIGAAIASIPLGATVIEKHFKLSKYEKGVDGEFSLDPIEFKSLVEESRVAWQSIGKIKYGPVDNEKNYLQYRRSLYVTQDMRKGEKFTKKNLKSIRPGLGLPVQNYEIIIGRKSSKAIKAGTALSWKLVN